MQKLIRFTPESFEFKKEAQSNQTIVKVQGQAIPFGKMSRNGVRYRDESVKKASNSLNGVSFLFNHDTNTVLGHVEASFNSKEGISYKADLDPAEEKYIRKIERGDIRHVSIGAMVSNPEFQEDGTVDVDIEEFVELSLVPVPGFKDTSAIKEGYGVQEMTPMLIAETFENKEVLKKLKEDIEPKVEDEPQPKESEPCCQAKEKKDDEEESDDKEDDKDESEDDKDKDESDDEDDKKESVDEERTAEEQLKEIQLFLKEQENLNEELKNRMSIVEARMDSIEQAEESADEDEDDKETDENEDDEEENFKRQAVPDGNSSMQGKVKVELNYSELRLKNLSY